MQKVPSLHHSPVAHCVARLVHCGLLRYTDASHTSVSLSSMLIGYCYARHVQRHPDVVRRVTAAKKNKGQEEYSYVKKPIIVV